jgi:hypothetical protein
MRRLLFSLLALGAGIAPVHAGDAEDGGKAPAVVTISALRDPELKSYRAMLKGADAFKAFSALAPDAELRFYLLPPPGAAAEGLSLVITDGDRSVGVPIAQDNSFELPRLPLFENTDAELRLNVKKDRIAWFPLVRTPGLPQDTRRLGDLRLECEVRWAAELHKVSRADRILFRSYGGPCHTRKVAVYFFTQRPLVSATLVEGDRRAELPLVQDGHRFVPPVYDATFSNEALVHLVYKDAAR